MKTKLATSLWVAAVLVAGSAAAIVNTEILDGGPRAAGHRRQSFRPHPRST